MRFGNAEKYLRRRPNDPDEDDLRPEKPSDGAGGSFVALQPQGYLIEFGVDDPEPQDWFAELRRDVALSAKYRHQFCGPHELPGAQCPNCERPMLRFLALDTRDPRLNLGDPCFASLPLLYCWQCPVAQGPLSYRILDDGDVSLLQYNHGAPETDFPYDDYPVAFPGAPARLIQLNDMGQHMLRQYNDDDIDAWYPFLQKYPRLMTCRHQYGGEPYLIQRDTDYQINCPTCSGRMPFLASIGDDCLDPRGFTENESTQVIYHYCGHCQDVSAFQQCD